MGILSGYTKRGSYHVPSVINQRAAEGRPGRSTICVPKRQTGSVRANSATPSSCFFLVSFTCERAKTHPLHLCSCSLEAAEGLGRSEGWGRLGDLC